MIDSIIPIGLGGGSLLFLAVSGLAMGPRGDREGYSEIDGQDIRGPRFDARGLGALHWSTVLVSLLQVGASVYFWIPLVKLNWSVSLPILLPGLSWVRMMSGNNTF